MFLPFFKIVQKTHTRWSQATKERNMEQNPRQQILEKETIKKTTARIEIRILIETLEKKCSRENRQVINLLRNPREKYHQQYIFIV
jgi:hypothetical protein